jgi:hypothetical protein
MIRYAIIACLVVSLLSAAAPAAEGQVYAVSVLATRPGKFIAVKVKLTRAIDAQQQAEPTTQPVAVLRSQYLSVKGNVQTLAAPQITLNDGGRGYIEIATTRAVPAAQPGSAAGQLESGVKIDAISILGLNKVLVVTTVIQDNATVWADATTVPVITAVAPTP